MSGRYVTIGAGQILNDNYAVSHTADTVIFDDLVPVRTGLLNASGVPLYRLPDRVPIGFAPPIKQG